MPHFDLVGFWIPAIIALSLLPRAFVASKPSTIAAHACLAVLSFMFPITSAEGVGLWPFWLLFAIYANWRWTWTARFLSRPVPVVVQYAWGFVGLAIADTILTAQKYGDGGTVGYMKAADGLMRYCLYPVPILIVLALVAAWVVRVDSKIRYSPWAVLRYHVSPRWDACLPAPVAEI